MQTTLNYKDLLKGDFANHVQAVLNNDGHETLTFFIEQKYGRIELDYYDTFTKIITNKIEVNSRSHSNYDIKYS